ncbi:MAG: type 4a pilus biogenesis protein PilO [Nitrospirota bacterium]
MKARVKRLIAPIIVAAAMAALDVGVYAVAVSPHLRTAERHDAAWKAERERMAQYQHYQRSYGDVTALTARAIARDDLPSVVTTVSSLAKKRGVKLPEVNYQPEKADLQDFQKVGLLFSVAGPYADVRRFLNDLERSSPFLAVESLSLTRARDKEAAQLDVQVKLAVYLRTT